MAAAVPHMAIPPQTHPDGLRARCEVGFHVHLDLLGLKQLLVCCKGALKLAESQICRILRLTTNDQLLKKWHVIQLIQLHFWELVGCWPLEGQLLAVQLMQPDELVEGVADDMTNVLLGYPRAGYCRTIQQLKPLEAGKAIQIKVDIEGYICYAKMLKIWQPPPSTRDGGVSVRPHEDVKLGQIGEPHKAVRNVAVMDLLPWSVQHEAQMLQMRKASKARCAHNLRESA